LNDEFLFDSPGFDLNLLCLFICLCLLGSYFAKIRGTVPVLGGTEENNETRSHINLPPGQDLNT
jgi:hypothetical protein